MIFYISLLIALLAFTVETNCFAMNFQDFDMLKTSNSNEKDILTRSLLRACRSDINLVRVLLSSGIEINSADENRNSALNYACSVRNNHDIIELLLQHNADPNLKSSSVGANSNLKSSPLETAHALYDDKTVVMLLKLGAKPISDNSSIPNNWNEYLHFGCKHKQLDIIALSIEKSATINFRDSKGETGLHIACTNDFMEGVRFLIKEKADLDATNKSGSTCLHNACEYNLFAIVQYLLNHRASPNVKNNDGKTPSHKAALRNSSQLLITLLDHRADPYVTDSEGNTLLHHACYKNAIDTVNAIRDWAPNNVDIMDLCRRDDVFRKRAATLLKCIKRLDIKLPKQILFEVFTYCYDIYNTLTILANQENNGKIRPLFIAFRNDYKRLITILMPYLRDRPPSSPKKAFWLFDK